MKLKFSIHYRAAWGQQLHAELRLSDSDGITRTRDVQLQTSDGELWQGEATVGLRQRHPLVRLSYIYKVMDAAQRVCRTEWHGIKRQYDVNEGADYLFADAWRDAPLSSHLLSQAYKTIVSRKLTLKQSPAGIPIFRRTLLFRVIAPQLQPGELLALLGNQPALGSWSPSQYLRMRYIGNAEWMLSVNADAITLPLEYKYVVIDAATHGLKKWEEGFNRSTGGNAIAEGQVLVLHGESLRMKEYEWRTAGVCVPLFSLRSRQSFGVGDFGDLQLFIRWAASAGLGMVELLPVNDTTTQHTWNDSHPYNCVSAFALHPHYVDLNELPVCQNATEEAVYNRQRRELNALSYSDYEAVDRLKLDYLRKAFEAEGEQVLRSKAFELFFEAHSFWLKPYAAFCALREHYHTAHWQDWHLRRTPAEVVEEVCSPSSGNMWTEVRFAYYTQFVLHRQLASAARLARENGVALMGDIPAGMYADSVETFTHPEWFCMNLRLGVAPTADEPQGQNWGMPVWRWDEASQDDIERFWRQRIDYISNFFDAVRIDNVSSYFRSWVIPTNCVSAVMGHYEPSYPLSEGEIESFGLRFRRKLLTRPVITDALLQSVFGLHSGYVKAHFLIPQSYGLYDLKPEFADQRKVMSHFGHLKDENSIWIRDGLCQLCANVLFIEDGARKAHYHPRYQGSAAPAFQYLTPAEQNAYLSICHHYATDRHNSLWTQTGARRLSAILSDCHMLVCGDTLGHMPSSCADVLERLRILSHHVQLLPSCGAQGFAHLESYPYLSMASPTTHDMAPMPLWWEENRAMAQRYWTVMLQKEGQAPRQLPPHIAHEMVMRHLYCPSMLCVVSLQDLLATDDNLRDRDVYGSRVNNPADCYNRWQYRMHVDIEELNHSTQFNKKIQTAITRSKR